MSAKGFTLIELMMVIAILAIIVAVAIPAYNSQVEKTRRADAQAALLNAAQALERCYTRSNSYAGCTLPTYDGGNTSPDGFYAVSRADGSSDNSYNLSAAPKGPQVDDACRTFTLDHLGNRGAGSESERCWGS